MRGGTLNNEKDCEPASFLEYRQSDKRVLSADARIIITLMKSQPLRRTILCKKAGVDESTFSRMRRVMQNKGIIKKTDNGNYCLFNFIETPTLWEKVKKLCSNYGSPLIKLIIQLQDESITDKQIDGIVVHRGAIELKAALSKELHLSSQLPDYIMYVLTTDCKNILENVVLFWNNEVFAVDKIEPIYDGNKFSFSILKIVDPWETD